jgi:hypothetical protein
MDPDTLATRALGSDLFSSRADLRASTFSSRADLRASTLAAAQASPSALAEVLPQNPAQVLATLMDFPGSVALAELLEAPLPAPSRSPEVRRLGALLLADVRARLDALEPTALKPLTGRRSPDLPSADELFMALSRHGVSRDATPRELANLAEALGAPIREALGTSLRKAQAHVATLRFEISADLRRLGPRADRLERIDAALGRAINAKLGELLDRMELAAQATFARACARAVEALYEDGGEPTREGLERWCAADGWIARYHERCVRMAKALFGHLRRGLEGLVRAVIAAEEP